MIGFFDSGFGGLNVLRGVVKSLPGYDYLYLGDSHRAPYGDRSQDEIFEFTKQGVDFLISRGAELVVLACNTASSEALREIQKTTHQKVLGVLIPFSEEALHTSQSKRIGVIATAATVRSRAFVREIKKLNGGALVIQQSCPRLVPLIEAGEESSELAQVLLREYLKVFRGGAVDTLILGCTHYSILAPMIREILGPDVHLIAEREVIPAKLAHYLSTHPEIEKSLKKSGTIEFYSTGNVASFNELGSRFFGSSVEARCAELS